MKYAFVTFLAALHLLAAAVLVDFSWREIREFQERQHTHEIELLTMQANIDIAIIQSMRPDDF